MATHIIKGFVTWRASPYTKQPEIGFITYDPRQFDTKDPYPRVVVAEHSFEVEVPNDFDPRPEMIELLRAAKDQARAEFAAKVTEYDRRISQLLAIENTVDAS
jgi:hypothetical protein